MPNYSLQINSQFKPFSFERYIQPLQLYGQAYKEQEEMLADLDLKASVWENMLNKEQDPKLYAAYSDYANNLRSQAEALSSQGLNPTSRQSILGLRSRYAKDITPIENAFNTRKEQSKMQLQAKLQNPDLLFSRDASSTKLLDYVNNSELDYDIINGKDVTQKVFTQAQALSKELIDNKEDLRKVLGGDYYEYVKQRGFTKEAVLAAIMNSPKASPELTQLVESAVDSTPVKGWNNDIMTSRVREYAKQGLWGAVGTSEAQLVNNWRAQTNLQHANAMELEDKRFEHAKEEAKVKNKYQYTFPFKSSDGKTYLYNPYLGMYTDEDGNIVERPKDAPRKIGTEPGNPKDNSKGDLSTISTMGAVGDAGYTLMGAGLKAHKGRGPWKIYKDGEDIRGGNVKSFFENHSWINRSDASFTPKNPGEINLDFFDADEIKALGEFLHGGGNINNIDFGEEFDPEFKTEFKDAILAMDEYLKSQGFMDGIEDDRIRIAKSNTPEEGKFDFLIFRK